MKDLSKHTRIVLSEKDGVPVRTLYISPDGEELILEEVCPETSEYGLGTCHCRSHDPVTFSYLAAVEKIEEFVVPRTYEPR